ncbi:MAG: helix-turn-helix transcriptional regulator [Bacteroidia bacterium]|nr:helix-turn-helix transcriptional regulator [Bacteroidia bacterium]
MINNRDKMMLKNFGKHLKQIRISRNQSQEELAFRCNFSKNQIGNIERGEVNPTLSTLLQLSEQLEVSPEELLNF